MKEETINTTNKWNKKQEAPIKQIKMKQETIHNNKQIQKMKQEIGNNNKQNIKMQQETINNSTKNKKHLNVGDQQKKETRNITKQMKQDTIIVKTKMK